MAVLDPIISFQETFYMRVAATTEEASTGVVIPDGERHCLYKLRANGADPLAYVRLVWDYGGASEKVIASTKGDIDITWAAGNPEHCYTGDGVKKMQIVIDNNQDTQSPFIGGEFQMLKVVCL